MALVANTNLYMHQRTNFNTLIHYYFPELPDLVSSQQVIFGFIIATLLTFLQIMYHKKPESPFETHPKTTLLAIGSLLMYCLSYDIKLRLRVSENHHTANYFFSITMALFSALSVACLLSILFPEWPCSLLFTLAVFYSLSYLPGYLIQTVWNWWQAVTPQLRRQQRQQRTSPGFTRFVSGQLLWNAEDDITDRSRRLPV